MTTPFNTNLKDQVAVVTGGGGVLGSYFCRTLESCETVASEIKGAGGEALAVQCDVTDKASVEKAREAVNDALGTCDVLVNGGFSAYSGV